MTDVDAALTDEELAEAFQHHVPTDIYAANLCNVSVICRACSHRWPCPTSRLIAALRASRSEVEMWKSRATQLREMHGPPA